MAFRRIVLPAERPSEAQLTRAMAGIGMRFAAAPDRNANIEDTLLFASEAGMEQGDLRVLSELVTWFGVHAPWVNADRLVWSFAGFRREGEQRSPAARSPQGFSRSRTRRYVEEKNPRATTRRASSCRPQQKDPRNSRLVRITREHPSERVRALGSAMGRWQGGDRRFGRLEKVYEGPRLDLLLAGTDFQLRCRGEDQRFRGSALRVPAGVLRDRAADVLDPATLCRRHRAYRYRVMMGPTYRADMWAALEAEPGLSAAELARRTYGSFATAWQVRRDYLLVHGGVANAETSPPDRTAPAAGAAT